MVHTVIDLFTDRFIDQTNKKDKHYSAKLYKRIQNFDWFILID